MLNTSGKYPCNTFSVKYKNAKIVKFSHFTTLCALKCSLTIFAFKMYAERLLYFFFYQAFNFLT